MFTFSADAERPDESCLILELSTASFDVRADATVAIDGGATLSAPSCSVKVRIASFSAEAIYSGSWLTSLFLAATKWGLFFMLISTLYQNRQFIINF